MTTVNGIVLTMNTAPAAAAHNGPVCHVCMVPYIGIHRCRPEHIEARIDWLQDYLRARYDEIFREATPVDVHISPGMRTRSCPCRRENGGSGVCGCVLGGPEVTS
jgi:hypothetical protein